MSELVLAGALYILIALGMMRVLRTQRWTHEVVDNGYCPYRYKEGACDCYQWALAGVFWPLTLVLRAVYLVVFMICHVVIWIVGDRPGA